MNFSRTEQRGYENIVPNGEENRHQRCSSLRADTAFFISIAAMGKINSPETPSIVKPVYMAARVISGCTPMLCPTIFGSIICRASHIIANRSRIPTPV